MKLFTVIKTSGQNSFVIDESREKAFRSIKDTFSIIKSIEVKATNEDYALSLAKAEFKKMGF